MLLRMDHALRHRGPDDQGFALFHTSRGKAADFLGEDSNPRISNRSPRISSSDPVPAHDLAMCHRRYSVVELSHLGHQPMWDSERRVCAAFNGEIYNYVELRLELECAGHRFLSRSDTEVLIAAYLRWGPEAFQRFNGPWALALYDSRVKALLLSRDRIGVSPLYHATFNNGFYWASEIKAILALSGPRTFPVNDQAIHDYVVLGRRDMEGTFWKGIQDFPPASFAWLSGDLTLDVHRYWKLPARRQTESEISVKEAAQGLRARLADSARLRLRADAPVAFELSGGIDSSSLVAAALAESELPLKAYAVKFQDASIDETPYAHKLVERYPGRIDLKIIRIRHGDFWAEADEFIRLQEEPFLSPNLHTGRQLRRRMREDGVKAAITGAGGDELFAGYVYESLPPYLRDLLLHGRLIRFWREMTLNSEMRWPRAAVGMLADVFNAKSPARFPSWLSSWRFRGVYRPPACTKQRRKPLGFSERMMENMGSWMMNYWLRSGNKSSFSIPIEPRSPFLDFRLAEYAFTLPAGFLIRDGWSKWILRQAMQDLLPHEVLWRTHKLGFPFPYRDWLQDSKVILLSNLRSLDCPYLNVSHLCAAYDGMAERHPKALWRLASLGLWWRRVIENKEIVQNG